MLVECNEDQELKNAHLFAHIDTNKIHLKIHRHTVHVWLDWTTEYPAIIADDDGEGGKRPVASEAFTCSQ